MAFGVPGCDLRSAIGLICPIVWVLVAGCASIGTIREHDDAAFGEDAGASANDAGADAGPLAPVPDGGLYGEDYRANALACSNGEDDDSNGASDCADPGCAQSPFCCLGLATAGCCAAPATHLSLAFSSCSDAASCDGTTMFGFPELLGDALVPTGDLSDSGLVLGAPLDGTRERISLSASIAAPTGGCSDCVDAIALGVSDPVAGDMAWVTADAAVLVRASRGDYALVIAGEVVATREIPDAQPHDYVLELSPDGAATLTRDGFASIVSTWAPRPARSAVLYGRRRNPPPGWDSARALSVDVAIGACEIPAAMAREGVQLLPTDDTWGSVMPKAPSAVIDGSSVLLAFGAGNDIHLARSTGGDFTLVTGDLDNPAIPAMQNESLGDPELVREGDHWVLYVTHTRLGIDWIARAEGDADFATTFGAPTDLLAPGDVTSLSDPSVATWNGRQYLAALAEVAELGSRVVVFELTGTMLEWVGTAERSTVATARGGLFAFDADEVDAPALFVDGANLMRVYYAGRRGSRWSIGVAVGGEAGAWLYTPDEPVLTGSGTSFDSLSVRDPSVVRTGSEIAIYYTASDGVRTSIGRALGGTRW